MSGDLGRFTRAEGTTSSKGRETTRSTCVLSYSCNGVMGYGPGCHRKLGFQRIVIQWVTGWWQLIFFIFTPKIAEDEPILIEHILQRGLQPPTSHVLVINPYLETKSTTL